MIDTRKLTNADIGRWIIYTDSFTRKEERGKLKSWNSDTVCVVFKCDNNWSRFQDYTGNGCDLQDVHFEYEAPNAVINWIQNESKSL